MRGKRREERKYIRRGKKKLSRSRRGEKGDRQPALEEGEREDLQVLVTHVRAGGGKSPRAMIEEHHTKRCRGEKRLHRRTARVNRREL